MGSFVSLHAHTPSRVENSAQGFVLSTEVCPCIDCLEFQVSQATIMCTNYPPIESSPRHTHPLNLSQISNKKIVTLFLSFLFGPLPCLSHISSLPQAPPVSQREREYSLTHMHTRECFGIWVFCTVEGAILGFSGIAVKFFTQRNYLLLKLNISFTNHSISSCNVYFTESTWSLDWVNCLSRV